MVLAAVFLLFSAFVLYRGAREIRDVRRLRSHGRAVVGTVVGHEVRPKGAKAIVVSYIDEHGVTQQITSSLAARPPSIAIGLPATVRYLPGELGSALIDERREHVRSSILVLVIGVGFAAAGVAFAVKDD